MTNWASFSLAMEVLVGSLPAFTDDHKADSRDWIVGTWQSYRLDFGDFGEWEGAAQVELVAKSPDSIELFLVKSDGNRSRAGDSEPSRMDDKTLFFGPIGSGLSFKYSRTDSGELIMDSKATDSKIHIELRRAKR